MKESLTSRIALGSFGLACASLMLAGTANATEGYFQNGVGARHKALAGAGVADTRDASAMALNPAGLVNAGHELDIAISYFAPDRGFTATGQGFVPAGNIDGNETSFFLVPDIAYARPLGENSAIGFSLDGNGGMNTDYAAVANPACAGFPAPAPNGIFCGGEAGVDLTQAFISVGYAHDFGGFSLGVAPVFAVQLFEAKGIQAFGGVSADPAHLTNNGHDTSTGFGLRLGVEVDLGEGFRAGATYQTKINMSEFDDYAGLFADKGDFDIPANLQAGIAFDATEKLTLMVDYRYIPYSDVASIANPQTVQLPLGSSDGPGFGWDDVNSWKFGAEYDGSNGWTWRGGVSFNDNPVSEGNVTFNIFAPGVVTQHYTFGFEKAFGEKQALQFAFVYVPEETVSGIEITPNGANPFNNIELRMSQFEATLGWKWKFGG